MMEDETLSKDTISASPAPQTTGTVPSPNIQAGEGNGQAEIDVTISKEEKREVEQEEEPVSGDAPSLEAPSVDPPSVDPPLSQDAGDDASETQANVPTTSCSETNTNPSSVVKTEEQDFANVKIKEEKDDGNDEAPMANDSTENTAMESEYTQEEHDDTSSDNISTMNTAEYSKDSEDSLINTDTVYKDQERPERRKSPSECSEPVSETSSEKLRNIRSARVKERIAKILPDGYIGTKPKIQNVRPGFIFEPGIKLEAMDYLNNWYAAKIVHVDWDAQEVQIHFEGWNSRYDEWVDFFSERLRPVPRQSNRKDSFSEGQHRRNREGEQVLARWTDCRFYPAQIISSNNNGSYQVLFYDGIKKNVQSMNIRDIPPSLQDKKAKDAAYEKEWSRANSRRKMERSQSFEGDCPTAHKRRLSGNNTPVQSKRVRHESTSPRLKELSDFEVSRCCDGQSSDKHYDHDGEFYSDVTDGNSDSEEDFMMPTNLDLEDSDDEKASKESANPGAEASDFKLVNSHNDLKVSRLRSLPTCAPSLGNGLQLMSEMPRKSAPVRCGQVLRWHHYDQKNMIYSRSRQTGSRIDQLQKDSSDTNNSIQSHNIQNVRNRDRNLDSETTFVDTRKDSRPVSSLKIPVQIPRIRPRYTHADPITNLQKRNRSVITSLFPKRILNPTSAGQNLEMTTTPIFSNSKVSVDQTQTKKSHSGKSYSFEDVSNTRNTVKQQPLHPSRLAASPVRRPLDPAHNHSSCCKCLQHYVDIKFRLIETQLRKLHGDILSEIKCDMQSVRNDVLEENRKGLEDFKDDVVIDTVACIMDEVRETIRNESKEIIEAVVRAQSSPQSELNARKSGTGPLLSNSVPTEPPRPGNIRDDTYKPKHQMKGSIWCIPSHSNHSNSGSSGNLVATSRKHLERSVPRTGPYQNKCQPLGSVNFIKSRIKIHSGQPEDAHRQSDRTLTSGHPKNPITIPLEENLNSEKKLIASQNNQLTNSRPESIIMKKKALRQDVLSQNMDDNLDIELEMSDEEEDGQECFEVSKNHEKVSSDHTNSDPGERPSITRHGYQHLMSDLVKDDGKKEIPHNVAASQYKECGNTQTSKRQNLQKTQPHRSGSLMDNGKLSTEPAQRNRLGSLKEHGLAYPKYYQSSPLTKVPTTKRSLLPFLSTLGSRTGGPTYVYTNSGNICVSSRHKIFHQESSTESAGTSEKVNDDTVEMVIIGSHPYKMEILKSVYLDIQNKSKSVTFFIRKLLSTLFTNDELASSRIDAGEVVWKSRRTFKNALDPFRLQVILMQAQKEFPGFNGDLLSDSMLREVINCKCRCAAFNNVQKD